jgi:hypothetical protein
MNGITASAGVLAPLYQAQQSPAHEQAQNTARRTAAEASQAFGHASKAESEAHEGHVDTYA